MDDKKSGKIRKKRSYYAQVSNVALRDDTMSLKAKGLLALIESYLSLENFTLYRNFLISKSLDGESSFRGAWNELKEHGYLIQYKLKDSETKQFYYEYEICDNPQVENHHVAIDKAEVEKPQVENPQVASPQVEEPYGSLATSSKLPPYNKAINNNNILNNNLYINIIRTNIDYNTVFVDSLDKELVDNIVDIMDEVLSSETCSVKVNNINIPLIKLKSIFLKVNANHIYYVLNVIKSYDDKIDNLKGFIITTIYNSVLTLDAYYTNLVNVNNNSNK